MIGVAEIVRVHISDNMAFSTVMGILNHGHEGRIRQKTLDFYRHTWRLFNKGKKSGGEILFLIAMIDNEQVGMSACAIPRKDENVWHSITVVHPNFRRQGVGQTLLAAKMLIMKRDYPEWILRTFVSKANEPSVNMCKSVSMEIVREGVRTRENKEPTEFFVFHGR